MTDTCQSSGLVVTLLLGDRKADRSGVFLAMPSRGAEEVFFKQYILPLSNYVRQDVAGKMYLKGHKEMAKVCCCGSAHHRQTPPHLLEVVPQTWDILDVKTDY